MAQKKQSASQSQVLQQRKEKAAFLEDAGVHLFPNDFQKTRDIAWIQSTYAHTSSGELEEDRTEFALAGRIVALRSFGKATFLHLQDESG